jgi:hypothetical protein
MICIVSKVTSICRFSKLTIHGYLHNNFSVRNALGEWKTLMDGENNIIAWDHIVRLYEYQKIHGFTLANKLTKQHVLFQKNKMKVKLAVQVLSKSVANSLLTMSQLGIEHFENVGATVQYLELFDSLYDIMNSRTLAETFGKAPLQQKNEEDWKSVFQKAVVYISGLKTASGQNVLHSNRYASFLGWLVNIKTMTELFSYIVKTGDLKFILTFKLSQDPLENFFSSIRMACGNNNNPTSIQFKSAFQSLLCNTLNRQVVFSDLLVHFLLFLIMAL